METCFFVFYSKELYLNYSNLKSVTNKTTADAMWQTLTNFQTNLWVLHTHIAISGSNPFTCSSSMLTMLLHKIMLHPNIVATCLLGCSGDSLVICLAADSTESLHSLVEYGSCLAGVSEVMNKN